jgi:hypothetical protein
MPGVSRLSTLALIPFVLTAPDGARAQNVQVVDMIPNGMSNEVNRDSEPYIAVNPANPNLIAATAFMPTPAMVSNGPLLVSNDGGATWAAQGLIPSASGGLNTFDVTIRFNTSGTALYAGMLRDPTTKLEIVQTTDMTFATPMTLLNAPRPTDQPYIYARTVTGWFDPGKDRLWVGNNEICPLCPANPASATVDQALDAAAVSPAFSQIGVDADSPVLRDNYQVRTVAHADGHVYAAFYRRKGSIAGGYNADVVVVRDDNWGKTMPPLQALVDSVTMVAGENVVAATPVSDSFMSDPMLGNEWWGGDLYLTVDPNDASRVFISYSDSQPGAARTLHLRRSTDFGQTWGPDLLTTASAKNAAIAVNSHGRIGYLYQALTGTSPNLHWETHLRRSDDGVTWDDVTLSNFPAQGAGSPGGSRIIGDYLNMIAVGKNFYGVFSAYNSLTSATFPAGITWQRNTTPPGDPMPRLLGLDGVTTVNPSIDPFFFRTTEIDPNEDFYVRDWTDTAATHDHGQEPSVRNNFYSTSDVWNERTNDPLAFDGDDRPQSHDPQPQAMGHNFAFARIGRESGGAANDVTHHYYYSDGGVGVNFVDAGAAAAPLHFASADLQQSPGVGDGHQWDLPSGASNHVCLAVEIATASDPLLSPSLLGHAPGWPTTDLLVVNDNNKAQRNLQVFGYGGMAGQAASPWAMFAIVHNAATIRRDMVIGLDAKRDLEKFLALAQVRILGGPRGGEPQRLMPGGTVAFRGMEPGEFRWMELDFTPRPGAAGPVEIGLVELANGVPLNGYSFVVQPMERKDAIAETLIQHAAVFLRLAEAFGIEEGKGQAKNAMRAAKEPDLDQYARFLKANADEIGGIVSRFLDKAGIDDPTGLRAAVEALAAAGKDEAQGLHLSLLNRLDAAQTMGQKRDGDIADIPQTVRWQAELFGRFGRPGAAEVVKRSDAFLVAFEARKVGVEGYAPLLAQLRKPFEQAAARDASGGLNKLLEAMTAAKDPTALQRVHRAFLLELDRLG